MNALKMETVTVNDMPGSVFACLDVWSKRPSKAAMLAYKSFRNAGQITDIKVTYNKTYDVTVFVYYSTIPRDWIRDALKEEKHKILCKENADEN